jgi:hypothetical protein
VPTLDGTERETSFTLSPGARGGWDIGDQQLILGVAAPITWTRHGDRDTAFFVYLSYELPFLKSASGAGTAAAVTPRRSQTR